MKNSLFKRVFATVASVPLALSQCLTYTSYAVTNDSVQSETRNTDSSEKEAYTLDNLLYIAPGQIESTWYSAFNAELVAIGNKSNENYIAKDTIVNNVIKRAENFKNGKFTDKAQLIVDMIDEDGIKYTISNTGDITVTGKIVNPDTSILENYASNAINKQFDKYKAEYENAKKEMSEKFNIPVEEFDTFNVSKEELAEKYGVSLEELNKYSFTKADIAEKLGVTEEDIADINTFDDIKLPVFDFSSIDISGTYEIVIEGSDLANGSTFDVKAKYTANTAVNGKTVFAVGDITDFVLAKMNEVKSLAYAQIDASDIQATEEAKKIIDKKYNKIENWVNKAKNNQDKIKTAKRSVSSDKMAGVIEKINNYIENGKYSQKIDNIKDKLKDRYDINIPAVPATVADIMKNSYVADIFDMVMKEINKKAVNYSIEITKEDIAAFADNDLYGINASADSGTYILTGDFPDDQVAHSYKQMIASVEVGDMYNADANLAKVGLQIKRIPQTTTSTTSTTTTSSATTETTTVTSGTNSGTDSTTTTTETSGTGSGTDSTTTTTETSGTGSGTESTTTTNTTGSGIVLNGEVKRWSATVTADEEAGYAFYYSHEEEFEKAHISDITLNVVYTDDSTEDIKVDFAYASTPKETFTVGDLDFKYNVPLLYAGEQIIDETGRVILKDGDNLKTTDDKNATFEFYIGYMGDVNLNYKVDAVDASVVATYYALLSTMQSDGTLPTGDDIILSTPDNANIKIDSPDSVYDNFAAFLADVNQSNGIVTPATNRQARKSIRMIDANDASAMASCYAKLSTIDCPYVLGQKELWDAFFAGEF